jgi:cysteinyl-tRNA synthetase
VYNTLTRELEVFTPQHPPVVTFYSCGPTVYDYQHIGNLRSVIANDTYKRVLEYNGYQVRHISNITDVGHLVSDADKGEDKMVKALKREGLDQSVDSMLKLAQKYTEQYLKDLEALNVEMPEQWAKATDHITEMIEIVQGLIKKGIVYETSTAFYFDTAQFPGYGALAKLKIEEQEAGARVEVDSEKRNPSDFAVWMKAVGDNAGHVMVWDAPFCNEKGFPGWHIECSAMSMKYLGETIDIHSGGIDHIPVHHTNEIAQSEAYTGKKFVHYWLHNEFLVVKGDKMSKSAGTFVTLSQLIEKGFTPLAYRYMLLQGSYRSPLNFTFEALGDAQRGLLHLEEKIRTLGNEEGKVSVRYQKQFQDAINNDFNTPQALAVLQEMLKDTSVSNEDKRATVNDFDQVLGLGLVDVRKIAVMIPQVIITRADQRLEAKAQKDYVKADALRDQIAEDGWLVKDTPEGYTLEPKNE